MKNKLLIALAVVAASSTAVAFEEGGYAGLAAGYDFGTATVAYAPANGALKAKGVSGDVILGINFYKNNNFLLGIESLIGISNAKVTENSTTVKSPWHGDLAFRAGMIFEDVFLYGKAGADYREFKVSYPNTSKQQSSFGLLVGAGAEYKMDQLGLRIEYNFARHELSNLFLADNDKINYQRVLLGAAWYF